MAARIKTAHTSREVGRLVFVEVFMPGDRHTWVCVHLRSGRNDGSKDMDQAQRLVAGVFTNAVSVRAKHAHAATPDAVAKTAEPILTEGDLLTLGHVLQATRGCRPDMHEPDESGVSADLNDGAFDNALMVGEMGFTLERAGVRRFVNLCNLLAVVRKLSGAL